MISGLLNINKPAGITSYDVVRTVKRKLGLKRVGHCGTLDPLAYWMRNGWGEDEFFSFTGTTREQHLERYWAVVHLETAARGAEGQYDPDGRRPEGIGEAIRTDELLSQIWSRHPRYSFVANRGQAWPQKAARAKAILREVLARI